MGVWGRSPQSWMFHAVGHSSRVCPWFVVNSRYSPHYIIVCAPITKNLVTWHQQLMVA